MNYELRILGFERQAQAFVFCRESEEVDGLQSTDRRGLRMDWRRCMHGL